MDDRFPKFLRTIVKALNFLALPNLSYLLVGFAILGYIAQKLLGAPAEQFLFSPQLVLSGEWWRLVTFPLSEAPTNEIFLLFYCFYVYFIVNAIEESWGAGPTTVFTLFAYACSLAGSFLMGAPVPIWRYVVENLSLAFGTLFPETELALFGIIPIKAKWLSLIFGATILLGFITASVWGKVFLLIVHSPYLLFFGPFLYRLVRDRRVATQRRRKWEEDNR